MQSAAESRIDVSSTQIFSIQQIETRLDELLPSADTAPQPLHRAMRHAVLSGGKRLRPRLLLAVAEACRPVDADPLDVQLLWRVGCAIEFIHSASLVHDDLPCFDDAAERRGVPTVHHKFGEALAVLAGDALLSLAFETLAEVPDELCARAMPLLRLLGRAAGSREGIIGGQSIEQGGVHFSAVQHIADTTQQDAGLPVAELLDHYHAMKSAALFKLAAVAGMLTMRAPPQPAWAQIGQCFGLAYQLIDDLYDSSGEPQTEGKPIGRDAVLGRPNGVLQRGTEQVRGRVEALLHHGRSLVYLHAQNPIPLLNLFDQMSAHMERIPSKAVQLPIEEPISHPMALNPQYTFTPPAL